MNAPGAVLLGDEAEQWHAEPAGADGEAERDPGGGAGAAGQVVLAELHQHRERDVRDQPDEQDQRQRGVAVRAQQHRRDRRAEQEVAEPDGAHQADPVGDPPAGEGAQHAAAELQGEGGAAEGAGRAEGVDPVQRHERVDAERDRGPDDLDPREDREPAGPVPAGCGGLRGRAARDAALVTQQDETHEHGRRDEQRGRADPHASSAGVARAGATKNPTLPPAAK
ncbi:hypothetical protein GCM10027610_004200 [Dactylosporangium cerinum]